MKCYTIIIFAPFNPIPYCVLSDLNINTTLFNISSICIATAIWNFQIWQDDNPSLMGNILLMSTDQSQEFLKERKNSFGILLPLFILNL